MKIIQKYGVIIYSFISVSYLAIADCGSSKTEWAVVDEADGGVAARWITAGANPAVMSPGELSSALGEASETLRGHELTSLYFYGAGCLPHLKDGVSTILRELSGARDVEVESDLLGAARGLLGRRRGVACILGTGSNSCHYDGEAIIDNVPSLGFILGDEGSGSYLGKMLLSDYLKRQMPEELSLAFAARYGIDTATAVRMVYRSASPNRFLASFAPFIAEHLQDRYMEALVRNGFEAFLKRNVLAYDRAQEMPIAFCGGVACNFAEVLTDTASSLGFTMISIVHKPMDGLITYHMRQ